MPLDVADKVLLKGGLQVKQMVDFKTLYDAVIASIAGPFWSITNFELYRTCVVTMSRFKKRRVLVAF